MAETYIKLRPDVEMRPESQAAESAVIVKDPITGGFYRFTAVQASVLERLNGEQDLGSIAGAVSDLHQIKVEVAQLEEFAAKLRDLLLLDNPACWSKLEKLPKTGRHLLQDLLSIKLLTFNPDEVLGRVLNRIAFAFHPASGIIAAAFMAAAAAITAANWDAMSNSIGTLLSLGNLPLIVLAAFVVLTLHEFGHGLALKHFGGKVPEMGLMILYLMPAFYCNVNDAWMLDKRKRMWVTIAGGYVQLFVCSLAIIGWRLSAEEIFFNRLFLAVIAFAGIQTLFNFIPLVRLDGYYLLSDWLEVPNLRRKSFDCLKGILRKLLLVGKRPDPKRLSTRERRICLLYGLSAAAFTGVMLWVLLQRLLGWMVDEFHTWGIIAATAVIFLAIPSAKSEAPKASGAASSSARALRKKRLIYWSIVIVVLVIVGLLPWELKVSGEFTIIPNQKISVNPEVEGTLQSIYVDEGARVHTGDVLAEIRNLDLNNSYQETRGELATKRADLQLLLAGSRPEELDRARRIVETKRAELSTIALVEQERKVMLEAVARKEAELRNAQENFERSRSLLKSGLIARNDVERDQTLFEVRRRELEESKGQLKMLDERIDRANQIKKKELAQAESELRILLAGSRKESIQVTEAGVKKLEEMLDVLARQIELLKIRSPIQGIVATAYLRNRVGEFLNKGDAFCEIVSEGAVIIDMPIPEKEIADVKLGYPITLKVRGYPKRDFQAQVKSIAPVAIEKGLERRVAIHGQVQDPEAILRAGMTGIGKVLCGRRMIAEIASRRLVRWLRTEFWEYLP